MCLAGLGRTGTFLLTLSLLKQHEKEGAFDSSKQLVEMRAARPGLVQSEEQYLFVLEAIAEALNSCSGDFSSLMTAKEIPARVTQLSKTVGGGLTGFDLEFKCLGFTVNFNFQFSNFIKTDPYITHRKAPRKYFSTAITRSGKL